MDTLVGDAVDHLEVYDQHRSRSREKEAYLCQILQIRFVVRPRHLLGHEALHQKLDAEDVHALADEGFDGRRVREDVFRALNSQSFPPEDACNAYIFAGDGVFTKLSSGFVGSQPCAVSIRV